LDNFLHRFVATSAQSNHVNTQQPAIVTHQSQHSFIGKAEIPRIGVDEVSIAKFWAESNIR
jgi:hypothetical protein